MKRRFGETNIIGVDVEDVRIAPHPSAHMVLWLGGKQLGRSNEHCFIWSLLSELIGISENATRFEDDLLFHLGKEDSWPKLNGLRSRHQIGVIEFFDDYTIYVVSNQSSLRFIWRNLVDSSGSVNESFVPCAKMKELAREFNEFFLAFPKR